MVDRNRKLGKMEDQKQKGAAINDRRSASFQGFTSTKVVEAPTQKVAAAHSKAPRVTTWARLW
jgi:hypothetical protein